MLNKHRRRDLKVIFDLRNINYKFLFEYYISVELTDSSKEVYRVNSQYASEVTDIFGNVFHSPGFGHGVLSLLTEVLLFDVLFGS